MMQKKLQVFSVLNALAGGDLCKRDLFDDSFSFSMPEMIVSGEFKRVLSEIKKAELFQSITGPNIDVLRYLEASDCSFVEVRLPKEDGFLNSAFLFEFSNSRIKKVKAFYLSSRSLSMSEESVDIESLNWPEDVKLFMEAFMSGEWSKLANLFAKNGRIKTSYQESINIHDSRNEKFFNQLVASPHPQIFKVLEGDQFCLAEAYWGANKTLFLWERTESQKFESWEFFGKSGLSLRTKSSRQSNSEAQNFRPSL